MRRPHLPVVLLALFVLAPSLHAGLTVEYVGQTRENALHTRFHYQIVFSRVTAPAGPLVQGDFVWLYDVGSGWDGSYVSHTTGPGWHDSISGTGLGPRTSVDDDPNLVDVKFAYIGVVPITTDTIFIGFSIVSTTSDSAVGDFATGRSINVVSSVGQVVLPSVPEPASLTTCAIGAGALLRRRRR